jgi:GNAT superfamily N-acetyltransferase
VVVIREARPEEYLAVGELVVDAYQRLDGAASTAVHRDYLEEIRDTASRAAIAAVLVAVEDAQVLGSVTYVAGPGTAFSEIERDGEAGFRVLAVRPDAQGRGIGRRLVLACIERARAEGWQGLAISTSDAMHAAHRLYERLGFVRAPDRDWSPGAGINLLAYVLDLDTARPGP